MVATNIETFVVAFNSFEETFEVKFGFCATFSISILFCMTSNAENRRKFDEVTLFSFVDAHFDFSEYATSTTNGDGFRLNGYAYLLDNLAINMEKRYEATIAVW
ncbi:hypothetical protein TNCV_4122611 [Trichonephila clavipes]|nr:hypothetical protein TNCV_4122611 [Trichonephila clavipes]